MTTPIDPYATATSEVPTVTQNQIPGNIVGVNSVTVNTSEINITGSGGVVLGYTGQPASGNLYLSLAANSGTDNFGNTYPSGLSVQSGQVQGAFLTGTQMDSTSTLLGTSIQNAQVLTPSISGGVASSLLQTMTNTNGAVLGYTSGSSAATYATNGVYQWTCPTGVTSIRVQCWGAGAGAGGGNASEGGETGGGGEYAEEPSYTVIPGQVYNIQVGQGGHGSATNGGSGYSGGKTTFSSGSGGLAVVANGGQAGQNGVGGPGGSGSDNTIHWDGGDGVSADGGTGGGGGGSSGGPLAEGNPGNVASGATGGAGGTGVSGGGAGGGGGNDTAGGTSGSAPGGAGGAAGSATAASQRISYEAVTSRAWYGSDATEGNASKTKTQNGTLYQGGNGTTYPQYGTQVSAFLFPQGQIASDWSGFTVTECLLWLTCTSAYYSTGMDIAIGGWASPALGNNLPSVFNGSGLGSILTGTSKTGQRNSFSLGASTGSGFAGQLGGGVVYYGIGLGPGNHTLYWYGDFNGTPNNGNGPVLTLAGSGSGFVTAGSGADGKVIITFQSGATPVYTLSVSATQSTDAFGNPYQQGFQGPQFTITGTTTASSVASSAVITASTTGTVAATNTVGFTGTLSPVQVDPSTVTVTAATPGTNLTKQYAIPAGDAQVGTIYQITANGFGLQGSTGQNLFMGINIGGTNHAINGIALQSNGIATAGTYFAWHFQGRVCVANIGTSGTIHTFSHGNITSFNAGSDSSNANLTNSVAFAGQDTALALNTVTGQTAYLFAYWGSTTGAPAIHCYNSSFERMGP